MLTPEAAQQVIQQMISQGVLSPDHHFDAGGTVGGTATGATQTTVSDWAAPVVGGMINAAIDTAGEEMPIYGGAKVADTSDLQNTAFTGYNNLTTPSGMTDAQTNLKTLNTDLTTGPTYTAAKIDTGLGPVGTVQSYMDPYLKNVVDVQADRARRDADILRNKYAAQMLGAGTFGGGRQAIMEAENARNLNTTLAENAAKGYSTAWNNALNQRLKESEQNRIAQESTEKGKQTEQQFGLDYLKERENTNKALAETAYNEGRLTLSQLQDQLKAGAEQRSIDQEQLNSDYADWLEQRDWQKKQLEWLKTQLAGYPMTATNTYGSMDTSGITDALGGALTASGVYDRLFNTKKP